MDALNQWMHLASSDQDRLGKSFLLDISFSEDPLSTDILVEYIGKIYGEENLDEVDFPCCYIALVTLTNPLFVEAAVMRFKTCTFPHITQGNGKRETCFVTFDVIPIIPMLAFVNLLVKDGMLLNCVSCKENPYGVLEKYLRIIEPNLGPSLIFLDWPEKEQGSLDVKLQFITNDIMKTWEALATREKAAYIYDLELKVVYKSSEPLRESNVELPPLNIEGLTSKPW